MSKRDDLFSNQQASPGSFRFDEQVVEVFPDMINRSVPGYSLIVPMIGQLARRYAQADSEIHDLGSSLGAVSLAIQSALEGKQGLGSLKIIATDNSQAMVDRFETLLSEADSNRPGRVPVHPVCGDIRETPLNNASMAILNFTLQFLAVEERGELLSRIAAGLRPGGVLVLAEKVRFEDEGTQERQTEWHHDYKRLQGYSELEIARKRSALEEVLKPELEQTHRDRLREAGFRRVTRWCQCFAFTAWLAEK